MQTQSPSLNPRLWFGTVVLGSAFALAVVSIHTIQVLNSRGTTSAVSVLPQPRTDVDEFTPVEKRIATREEYLQSIRDPIEVKKEQRYIATLYQEMGARSESKGQLPHAEAALLKASAYDPENPRYVAALAGLYADAATKPQEPKEGAQLMESAAENWKLAGTITRNEQERNDYRQLQAIARTKAARFWITAGNKPEAQGEIEQAKQIQVGDDKVREAIEQVEQILRSQRPQ